MSFKMKNILIKGSGDVTSSKGFFDLVVEKAHDNYVVVICSGGTKISAALEKAGHTVAYDMQNRRITKTLEERTIMRDILEEEEKRLQDVFVGTGVVVVSPILYAGSVVCPINGDDLVKAYDLGFDEIYVLTKPERVKKKRNVFKEFANVEVVGL